jgi:ubiquinone biosynthesis protein
MSEAIRHASLGVAARNLLGGRLSRHPERYLEVFRIVRRYKLHHVLAEFGAFSHQHLDEDRAVAALHYETDDDHPRNFALALEELGPCFIKLGQLLSTRPDLLPADYIEALSRLQGAVSPVPSDSVVRIIESELGGSITELFQSFDCAPLATASMAQVHRAVLPDGQEVAVKVQRPGVRQRIEIDVEMLRELATMATRFSKLGARYGLLQTVRELEYSLSQELDFRQEADNTRVIGSQIAGFEHLLTPSVHAKYTTARVLTLSFIHGRHLAEVSQAELESVDAPAVARDLLSAYLKQAAIDGVFHCDPHPGNIMLTADGRLALMDFGMVGRFDAGQKDKMILLLLAFSERLGERVAGTYLDMVEIPKSFDRRAFTQDVSALVSRYHDLSGGRMALGTALLDLTRVANRHRTPVPTSLTLLAKTLLNLDGTIRVLSPELDPVQLIRDYMQEVMQERIIAQFSPGRVSAWMLDMKHLVENSPRHVETALAKLSEGQLTLRIEPDSDAIKGLQRTAGTLSRNMLLSSIIIAGGYVLGSLMRRADPPGRS